MRILHVRHDDLAIVQTLFRDYLRVSFGPKFKLEDTTMAHTIAHARSLVARISAWNQARRTRAALSRLSAHELDDIGLSRGDIDRIV